MLGFHPISAQPISSVKLAVSAVVADDNPPISKSGERRADPRVASGRLWVNPDDNVADDAPIIAGTRSVSGRRGRVGWAWSDISDSVADDSQIYVASKQRGQAGREYARLWQDFEDTVVADDGPIYSSAANRFPGIRAKANLWLDDEPFTPPQDDLSPISLVSRFKRYARGVPYTIWADLEDAVTPVPDVGVYPGSGHPVDWQGKRKKLTLREQPEKHLRHILDKVVSEYYAEIVEGDAKKSAKSAAAAVVRPFVESGARGARIPKPERVDWEKLENDAQAVASLLAIWSSQFVSIDDDDAFFMMMI